VSHKKVRIEETELTVVIEYYGENFPVHPEEWKKYHSFWQEDYARFFIQKDVGLLTIYYAKQDLSLLWEGKFHSMHDVYAHLNERQNPFSAFIYGEPRFEDAFRLEDGIVKNFYMSKIREVFNEAYHFIYKSQSSKINNK